MKLIPLLSAVMVLGLVAFNPSPAWAVPGQTIPELQQWVKKHAFLAPYLQGPIDYMDDEVFWIGFRQIDSTHFLDVVFAGLSDKRSPVIFSDELKLVQRAYQADLKPEYGDKRPWKDIALVDVWSRDNPTAYALIRQVYSPAIAADFQKSQLIFKGPEYTYAYPGTYARYKIPDLQYEVFAWVPEVQVYQGKHFTYEVSPMGHFGSRYETMTLKIRPVSEATMIAATLQHNFKMYQVFQAKEAEKQRRLAPAKIDIIPETKPSSP